MAHEKVSNHDLVIVTNGTRHKLVADKQDDMLFDPKTQKPTDAVPGENYIYSEGMTIIGASMFTLAHDEKICLVGTAVGTPSEPDRTPTTHGQNTLLPHRGFAEPTEGSPDLNVEGKPVVRTGDPTLQNGDGVALYNTSGIVDGSEVGDEALTELAFLKQKCAIEGAITGGTTGKKPAVLGEETPGSAAATSGGEEPLLNYLEILTGEAVELEVRRVDLTKNPPARAEECELDPEHTRWVAVRSGFGPVERIEQSGPKLTIGKSKTELPLCQPDRNQVGHIHSTAGDLEGSFESNPRDEIGATVGAGSVTVKSPVLNVEADWAGFMRLWQFHYDRKQALINVDAQACTNPQNAKIRLYPSRKAKLKIEFPTVDAQVQSETRNTAFDRLRERLMTMKEIVDFVAKLVGVDVKFDFKLLNGFYASVDAEFKRCERIAQYDAKKVSPAHVGLYWKIEIGCTHIVYMSFTLPIPLASFVAKAVPVIGPGLSYAIKKLEKWLEIEIGIEFTVGFGFGMNANFERDQHGEWLQSGNDVAATIEGRLDISLYAQVVALKGNVGLDTVVTGRIGIKDPENPSNMFRLHFEGEIKPKFYAGLEYKGRFSRIATAALIGADVGASAVSAVGDAFSSVGRWFSGDDDEETPVRDEVREDDFLSVSGTDRQGMRTVRLEADHELEPLHLGPADVDIG